MYNPISPFNMHPQQFNNMVDVAGQEVQLVSHIEQLIHQMRQTCHQTQDPAMAYKLIKLSEQILELLHQVIQSVHQRTQMNLTSSNYSQYKTHEHRLLEIINFIEHTRNLALQILKVNHFNQVHHLIMQIHKTCHFAKDMCQKFIINWKCENVLSTTNKYEHNRRFGSNHLSSSLLSRVVDLVFDQPPPYL